MDVNKLKHVLTDLKTLSDVVDKEVVKKMYMIIGSKNLIPLILPDLLLLKKTDYDANDIKFEIPSVSGLVTAATLNAVDNERPDMSNLVKKQITVQKYQILSLNTLPHLITINLQILEAKIKNKNLINESDIFRFITNFDLNKKIKY